MVFVAVVKRALYKFKFKRRQLWRRLSEWLKNLGVFSVGGKGHGGEGEDLKYLNHMYFPAEPK